MDLDSSWTVIKRKKKFKNKNKHKPPQKPTYTQDSDVTILRRKKKYEHKQRFVNKSKSGLHASELDGDTSQLSHKFLRNNVKRAIIKGRNSKKLTRVQLAQKINVKPSVIANYEMGNPIVDRNILRKLEKVLGVKLIGNNNDIGKSN